MYLWHVHIINKDEEPFSWWGTIGVLGSLLHIGLQVSLNIQRGGSAGEVHVEQELKQKRCHNV